MIYICIYNNEMKLLCCNVKIIIKILEISEKNNVKLLVFLYEIIISLHHSKPLQRFNIYSCLIDKYLI